jgi:hypothetical protein
MDEDCAELPTATMCASGYCVDDKGSRVDQSSSALHSCNPLTPLDLPVKLGTVWGMGRDDAGTTYLVNSYDVAEYWRGVFVSEGNVLVRRELVPVVGALGGQTDTGKWDRLEFDDGSRSMQIVVTRTFSQDHPEDFVTTAMSIGPAGATTDGLTPLTLEDPSVISGFTLKNLSDPDGINFLAYVDDGTVILATHRVLEAPEENDARVFWGRPDDVRERRLFTNDPVTNRVLFDDGTGGVVTAALTGDFVNGGYDEQGTLSGPGISATLKMNFQLDTLPADLSFSCR